MNESLLISHNQSEIKNAQNDIKTICVEEQINLNKPTCFINILKSIKTINPNVIFINAELTDPMNYAGIWLAYHIRLSTELGDLRFAPIVLLCDDDLAYIGKNLRNDSYLIQIFFTPSIFLSTFEGAIDKYKDRISKLNSENYHDGFVEKIEIKRPKSISNSHDATNEWAIYKWASLLDAKSEALKKNATKIENDIFFKYILAKNKIKKEDKTQTCLKNIKNARILYIDDEYTKGWGDILGNLFADNKFKIFQKFDDDKENLISNIKSSIDDFDPDIIILDFRLHQLDHDEHIDLKSITSVEVIDYVRAKNPGIKCIVMSATSRSEILNFLYIKKRIFAFIKKEGINDIDHNTKEHINTLIENVKKAVTNKKVKKVYELKQTILESVKDDNFPQDIKLDGLQYIFNVLDSSGEERFKFATTVLLYNCFESINGYFKNYINFEGKELKEREKTIEVNKYLNAGLDNETINKFFHIRNQNTHQSDREKVEKIDFDKIIEWLNMLRILVNAIIMR